MSTSLRCMARSPRASRISPFRRRRRAVARSCSQRRSPRPPSPSTACASSSIAGCRASRAMSPMSASLASKPCACPRAAADQRRGRAGRTEPGVCYRLWDEPQTGSLEPYTRPEILSADLSSFVLDLAHWGAADPAKLAFLDAPPQAALAEARVLLKEIGAIDAAGRITDEGRKLRCPAIAAALGPHGGRRCRRGERCARCNHCRRVDGTRTWRR